jgi:hypothetical protein
MSGGDCCFGPGWERVPGPATHACSGRSSRRPVRDRFFSSRAVVRWSTGDEPLTLRLGRAREAQSPGHSGVDFPPDWTPDRGSGVSGCCCPMDTGVGGLFGPRPLTMRVRERGRGPSREEGWWWTSGGFGRWVGGPGDRESEKKQQHRRRRARGWQRCGVVAVCGVGRVGAQRWLSAAVSDAAARMASAASTSRRSWRDQRPSARGRARRSRSSWRRGCRRRSGWWRRSSWRPGSSWPTFCSSSRLLERR